MIGICDYKVSRVIIVLINVWMQIFFMNNVVGNIKIFGILKPQECFIKVILFGNVVLFIIFVFLMVTQFNLNVVQGYCVKLTHFEWSVSSSYVPVTVLLTNACACACDCAWLKTLVFCSLRQQS